MSTPFTNALRGFLTSALLAAGSFAQTPSPTSLQESLGRSIWLTPIDPMACANGSFWASGPNYKVAFDDGVTFYPVLGADAPEHLPLRWRTVSITRGDHAPSVVERPATKIAGQRYELHWNGIVEAYDVREDGVEQTFVLVEPKGAGDLRIRGRLETPLVAPLHGTSWNGLTFRDGNGDEILRYGKVTVIDANGEALPIPITWDGEEVDLHVPGAWLDSASYPVTVDPLLSATTIASGSQRVSYPNVARDDLHDRLLVTFSRRATGNDYDFYVALCDDAFQLVAHALLDLTVNRSTRFGQPCFVRNGERWVVAYGVTEGSENWVRILWRDAASTSSFGGSAQTVPRPNSSFHCRLPRIAGGVTFANGSALLVYERDFVVGPWTSTDDTRLVGHMIHATQETVGFPFLVRDPGTADIDCAAPSISADSEGDGWLVTWEERTNQPDEDWRIGLTRVDLGGNAAAPVDVSAPLTSTTHKLSPKIAGSNGRYLLTWLTAPNTSANPLRRGTSVRARRIDWPQGQAAPTLDTPKSLVFDPNGAYEFPTDSQNLAFDRTTDSHWALAYDYVSEGRLTVTRLGYTPRSLETLVMEQDGNGVSAYSPAVTFDDDAEGFVIVNAKADNGDEMVQGRRLVHPNAATAVSYGTACGGTLMVRNQGSTRPLAGSELFGLRLWLSSANAPSWLYASAGSAQISLPGLPCDVLLMPDATLVQVASALTDGNGAHTWSLPIPEMLAGVDVYWQAVQLDGNQIRTSNGLLTSVR